MKNRFLGLFLVLSALTAGAQNRNSFAIITDSVSYDQCRAELEAYRASVIRDGLDAFIVPGPWESPEQVRDSLRRYHAERALEGAVFVGDIPIPMVRKAHHLTSAFKMSEQYPMRESSVPSDRFYDDFDLSFRFIARDTVQSSLFYYELAPSSPQYISCDIYTARIKPSGKYQDPYRELSSYLRKAVAAKQEDNLLDEITSYTGDGSFSNSLVAWKDETITLSEQMPDACSGKKGPRFHIFAMQPYMKETMLEEIRRPELDLVLFHEHGMPERQYLTGYPDAYDIDGYHEMGRFWARMVIRQKMRYGMTLEEARKDFAEQYDVLPAWYEDSEDPEVFKADSLFDLKTGIILDDIWKAAPNVKVAIFDACYNGDFREEDCVANRYVMSGGDCVAAIGNSVNVLQDKSSSDLMGMLAAGYRIGEWMQQVNILESHILGDPTYRFRSSYPREMPLLDNPNCGYWLHVATGDWPCDIRGLALHKLHQLGYEGLPELLLETYRTSPYYMERLQCMHLLAHYEGEGYKTLIREALDDPYEFIRRKASTYSGRIGSDDLVAPLVEAYLNDCNSKRVAFDIGFSAGHFADSAFVKALKAAINSSDFILDKEEFSAEAEELYRSPVSMAASTAAAFSSQDVKPSRKSLYMSGMRNNPYTYLAKDLTGLVRSGDAPLELRVQAAETLGWFTMAWNRREIQEDLKSWLQTAQDAPQELAEEVERTLNRLADYLR